MIRQEYLYVTRNRHPGRRSAGSVVPMSHYDARVERPEQAPEPVSTFQLTDDDVPARRLLAHDLEPLAWDHDGDESAPPPD